MSQVMSTEDFLELHGVKSTHQVMSTEDFLAHFGVKGMKWGVRKERDSSGNAGGSDAAFVAKRTAQNLAVIGSTHAGRVLGVVGGTSLGPMGTMVGGFAGSVAGSRAGARVVYGNVAKKKAAAKKDLPKLLPQRSQKYSDGAAKRDIDTWGPDAAQRINRSMNNGMTLRDARRHEGKLQRTATLLSVGLGIVQTMALNKAVNTINSQQGRAKLYNKAAQRGARRHATRRPSGPPTKFTTPGRGGTFNISSLK